MSYVATINVPGYLPMDDDPPTFDTAQEAWAYLLEERKREEDTAREIAEPEIVGHYSETVEELAKRASDRWLVCDFERVGFTVYGDTPGYGSHDLGLAYSVTEVED